MSTTTARFIIHREGLDVFNLRELRDLLTGGHVPPQVRAAILTLINKGATPYAG